MAQASDETIVQLNPDGSGKSVRTIGVTTIVNGVPTPVYMQVVALSDDLGNIITFNDLASTMKQILVEMKRIRLALSDVTDLPLEEIVPDADGE